MKHPRTLLAAIPLALSALVVAAQPAASAAPTHPSFAPPTEVTLITGDRVLVGAPEHGRPTLTVLPAPRPGHVAPAFGTRFAGDDVYVVPNDVAKLVPSVLDSALFDVTALARMGYDDASRADLPLIVQNAPGVRRSAAAPSAMQVQRALPSIGGAATILAKSKAAAFGRVLTPLGRSRGRMTAARAASVLDGVRKIWLDAPMRTTDWDANLTQINAPGAWSAGLSGAGVTVAVLDTGVDAEHPDLAGQVAGTANFTTDENNADDNGHGTHVASLVAGTGAMAAGARRGVAYGAHLLAGKVLDGDGHGLESWVIAGMQWAVAQGADVVSMSLGGPASDPSANDPVDAALESLTASSGALFVVAAGNDGSRANSIQSPGDAPSALTVGAVGPDDATAFFSSRGPTLGDGRIKPDISAPGINIIGARAGARTGDGYTTYSGTSQATPQVAGAAALVRQQHPSWTPAQVKNTLVATADPVAKATVYDQGGGRLNLGRATTAILSASDAELDFGLQRWPDRSAHTKHVTLSNRGGSALTVDLAAGVAEVHSGPSTGVAPADDAGPVTLSTDRLTVPAGGTAGFDVTLDPARAKVGTLYTGAVTAAAGGERELNLPLGFEIEPESYDVDVTVLDRHGDPYVGGVFNLINTAAGNAGSKFDVPLDAHGHGVARVGPGWYGLQSYIETPAVDGSVESVTLSGIPELHVTGDRAITIDARTAKPLQTPTVPRVTTRANQVQVYYSRLDDGHSGFTYYDFPYAEDVEAGKVFVQPSTRPVTHGQFAFTTRWRLLPTRLHAKVDLYDLMFETRTVPNPVAYHLTAADVRRLARLDVDYHASGLPTATDEIRASWTDVTGLSVGAYRPVPLPSHRVELVSAAPNFHFQQSVIVPGAAAVKMFEPVAQYQPGEQRTEHWLRAVRPDVVEAPRYVTSQWFSTGLGDGQHAGRIFASPGNVAADLTIRNGDAVVGHASDTFGYFAVPPTRGVYTATEHLTIPQAQAHAPGTSDSTWTFTSIPSNDPSYHPSTIPAIVKLDYQPDVDALGYVRADKPLHLDLTVNHQPGSIPPAGAAHDVTLSYSVDDGASWHSTQLVRVSTFDYETTIPAAALKPGRTISLHGTAADAQNNSIDQVLHRFLQVQ
jgi:hypothetical protein